MIALFVGFIVTWVICGLIAAIVVSRDMAYDGNDVSLGVFIGLCFIGAVTGMLGLGLVLTVVKDNSWPVLFKGRKE